MQKKGISPLIATVLLIGFTIVLAALVMRWGTDLFEGTASTQECLSMARIDCTNLEFSLTSITNYDVVTSTCLGTGGCYANITVRNNNAKDIDHLIFVGTDVNGATSYYSNEGASTLFSITDSTVEIDGFDSNTFRSNFTDVTQMKKTVSIEVIPALVHTTDDGDTCNIECTEKSKTYTDFPWVA